MSLIEFWPDYGPGPLWAKEGGVVDPTGLPISADLAARITAWNGAYEEDKVPLQGPGDTSWLSEGKRLLAESRAAVGDHYDVEVTEPWWGEAPS
ncbi:hypothetical protein [Nocardioides rubriscoriae]|uniref:hypothetical protein n=1 Tax=Nocardioides rubriscoriae TaxID=642762 RepID=UPI0011DF60EC|nr:hypothetical protein [Nocardioides rubriscoriae]